MIPVRGRRIPAAPGHPLSQFKPEGGLRRGLSHRPGGKTEHAMQIGFILSNGHGNIDPVLCEVASTLQGLGYRLSGTVQMNAGTPGHAQCDMDISVLPDGPRLRISESRGPFARGCRLDAEALETAVEQVRQSLSPQTDLLIVNKFGKHEAEGRGFRSLIADALMLEVPVLLGVNMLNKEAFDAFSCELAQELIPSPDALVAWAVGMMAGAEPGAAVGC